MWQGDLQTTNPIIFLSQQIMNLKLKVILKNNDAVSDSNFKSLFISKSIKMQIFFCVYLKGHETSFQTNPVSKKNQTIGF